MTLTLPLINYKRKKVVFFNREYKAIPEIKSIDNNSYEYGFKTMKLFKEEERTYDGFTGVRKYFYDDATSPLIDEKKWMDYWITVFSFCQQLIGVPSFIRYNAWCTKQLFVMAKEISNLQAKNRVLEEYKDAYLKGNKKRK